MTEFDNILGADPLPIDERSEKAIQNDTLVSLSAIPRSLFFRNNTGQAWQGQQVRARAGQTVTVRPGMVILESARPIRFGLEGSGDIIGAAQETPVAVEVKDAVGRQRRAQQNFQRAWEAAGGIYVLARSAVEAERKVNEALASRIAQRKVEKQSTLS